MATREGLQGRTGLVFRCTGEEVVEDVEVPLSANLSRHSRLLQKVYPTVSSWKAGEGGKQAYSS